MHKSQNKQMLSNLYGKLSPIFLKLCYFMIVVLLISCRGDVAKKENNEQLETTKTESTEDTDTDSKTILFFGDSLTAGYGLDDVNDAFPSLIQSTIDSLGLNYTVVNSGLSGETSAGGKSRLDWVLKQKIDVFVLELGANDGLRGIPLTETRKNLQDIIDAVQKKLPEATIILAGMELPPNMGPEYTSEFRTIFSDLAEKNNLPLIPFILKDVGGVKELNLEDGIHPTAEGHQIVAKNVWEVLEKVIK
ncbi:arylesterase [Aureibaculum sp. 2210JD6-5]|uniref:arylesterase n=1 Tax=Aureibaculum sp. 2210JD6-5 TaxID=3103957 RepID=UPI002AAD8102|nr:arylesterase [Aureibaculum sp. 2210JD6-5]MDY7394066.1 arylesterase [Aureibaculum sp. 2210JD6-5]